MASTTEIYLLTVLEAGNLRSRNQHDQILRRAFSLVCRLPLFVSAHKRRRDLFLSSSFYKATVLLDQGPTLMTSFNLNYLLKILSLDTFTLGVRVSTYEFWGDTNSVHIEPGESERRELTFIEPLLGIRSYLFLFSVNLHNNYDSRYFLFQGHKANKGLCPNVNCGNQSSALSMTHSASTSFYLLDSEPGTSIYLSF